MVKLGQMASYVDEGLAPSVRRTLGRLQDSVPPMSPELAAGESPLVQLIEVAFAPMRRGETQTGDQRKQYDEDGERCPIDFRHGISPRAIIFERLNCFTASRTVSGVGRVRCRLQNRQSQ